MNNDIKINAYRVKGLSQISTEYDFTPYKIFQVINMCFGKDYRGYMKAGYNINDSYGAWFPKISERGYEAKIKSKKDVWINIVSPDGSIITELNPGKSKYDSSVKKESKNNTKHRLVFAKYSTGIKFLGLFVYMDEVYLEDYHKDCFKRVATKVNLDEILSGKAIDTLSDVNIIMSDCTIT